VNTLDPLVLTSGGASSEVGPLVAFVAKDTHMTPRAVLGALTTNFPHVTALLEAIPLSAANGEIPGLEKYLEGALHVTPAQLLTALQTNFPALYQSISQLPYVVNGWDNVPGTQHLTRFDGSPVNTVPEIRNYFASDVIPVLTAQQRHFSALSSDAGVGYLSPLLLGLGIVVILVGLGFALGARTGRIWRVRATNSAAWTLVTAVAAAGGLLA